MAPSLGADVGENPTIAPVAAASGAAITRGPVHATAGSAAGALPIVGPAGDPRTPAPSGPLHAGSRFGPRYHLIRLLGTGGMGAVYQAWDEELAVVVAIKVIRPDAMVDPVAARDLERRFKRELLLARNVTHKNVVRIHDLGEVDGVKYITMPYVNGVDLATLLGREGRLPVARAVAIARQVASGLAAAHEAGVVHRDLKPANILLDEDDRALITDFGIARSVAGTGGNTVAGTVVGTLEFMAPEQARGETVDHRADIYAFGLMLSDMLVGRRQLAPNESGFSELLSRMNAKSAASPRAVDPALPVALDEIVCRAADPDPAKRYQHTSDLLGALEAVPIEGQNASRARSGVSTAQRPRSASITISLPTRMPGSRRTWLAAGLLLVILAGGTIAFRSFEPPDASATAATPIADSSVSLAVLPFRNASGDASLDWLGTSLADVLGAQVGQASTLQTVPAPRVLQILQDLRIPPDAALDPAALARLAELSGADTVVWGQYVRFGQEIRVDATLQDLERQRTVPLQMRAANEAAVPASIERLAAQIRDNLALSKGAIEDLAATAFKPSTHNVAALRHYTEGLGLSRAGRHLVAVERFKAAIGEDPNFALAQARAAQAYAALGQGTEAERFSRAAMTYVSDLPPQERYLVLATRARALHDQRKATEYYETIRKTWPQNDDVAFALATLYEDAGDYDRSRRAFGELLARDPRHLDALLGAGRIELRTGNPNAALGHLTPALTAAIQTGNDEARAAILWAHGVTYRLVSKPDEALRHFRDALEIDRRIGRTRGVADNLHSIAQVLDDRGQSDQALASYSEALALRRQIGDARGIGDVLLDMGTLYWGRGRYEDALAHYTQALQVQREVRNQAYEALALNNIGAIHMSTSRFDEARTHLEQALTLREKINAPADAADTLHNLGDIALKTGEYDAASERYFRALELRRKIGDTRGVAIEQWSMGLLFEHQGRYGPAVDARADALKGFREIGEGGVWLARALAGYGSALGRAGRLDEADKTLGDALARAKESRNQEIVAEVLNLQGETFFFRGDHVKARRQYEAARALARAEKLGEPELASRLSLAMLDLAEGKMARAAAALRGLGGEAERLGLRHEAVHAALLEAEASLRQGHTARAREMLDAAQQQVERLGSLPLVARAHHLEAQAAEAAGDRTAAKRHDARARQILDELQKQSGGHGLEQRADLRELFAVRNAERGVR